MQLTKQALPKQLPAGSNFDPETFRRMLNDFDENSDKLAIIWPVAKVTTKGKNMHRYAPVLGIALIGRLQSIYHDQSFEPRLFASSFNPKTESYVCVIPAFLAEIVYWMGPLTLRGEDDNEIYLGEPRANELTQKARGQGSILFAYARMEHGCTAKPSDVEKATMAAFGAANFRVTEFKPRVDDYGGGTGEYIVHFEMDDPSGISLAEVRRLRTANHRTVWNDPIYIALSEKMCEAYQLCSSCLAAKPVCACGKGGGKGAGKRGPKENSNNALQRMLAKQPRR